MASIDGSICVRKGDSRTAWNVCCTFAGTAFRQNLKVVCDGGCAWLTSWQRTLACILDAADYDANIPNHPTRWITARDMALSITVPSRRYPTLASAVQGATTTGRTVISLLEGKYEVSTTLKLTSSIVIQAQVHPNGEHDSVTLSFKQSPCFELLHNETGLYGLHVTVKPKKPYGRASYAVIIDSKDASIRKCHLVGGGVWVKCATSPALVLSDLEVRKARSHAFYITEANSRKHIFRAEYAARKTVEREIVERAGDGRDVYDWEFDADEDDEELAEELRELAEAATTIEKVCRGYLCRKYQKRIVRMSRIRIQAADQNGVFVDGGSAFGELAFRCDSLDIDKCGKHGVLVQGQVSGALWRGSIKYCKMYGIRVQTPNTNAIVGGILFKRCKGGGISVADEATAHIVANTFDNNGGVPIEIWGEPAEQIVPQLKRRHENRSEGSDVDTNVEVTNVKNHQQADNGSVGEQLEDKSPQGTDPVAGNEEQSPLPTTKDAPEQESRSPELQSPELKRDEPLQSTTPQIPEDTGGHGHKPHHLASANAEARFQGPISGPSVSADSLREELAAINEELDTPFNAEELQLKIKQINYEMQLAIDEKDFKWAGILKEIKKTMERGEEGYRGDLAVRKARITRLLAAKDNSAEAISVALDRMNHAAFRPIKSTRQRIENERAHANAIRERQTKLQKIEVLAHERAKFEISHIPKHVEFRVRAPSFLYPTIQDAIAACPRDQPSAVIVPEGTHFVEGAVVLDRPVTIFGAKGSNAILCVRPPTPRLQPAAVAEDDPEEVARQSALAAQKQRQLRERNLRQRMKNHGRLLKKSDAPATIEDESLCESSSDNVLRFDGAIVIAHKGAGLQSVGIKVLGEGESMENLGLLPHVSKQRPIRAEGQPQDASRDEDIVVPPLKIAEVAGDTNTNAADATLTGGQPSSESSLRAEDGSDSQPSLESRLLHKSDGPAEISASSKLNYLPFDDAREYVRSLNITEPNLQGWLDFCAQGTLPVNIPLEPHLIYADTGFASFQDWIGSNLQDKLKVLHNETTAAELADAQRTEERVKWDTTVLGAIAIAITSEEALVSDCSIVGGGVWVNLGGVLRQARTTGGQSTKILGTTVSDSPGCGLLVTGRKSMPIVEHCTFTRCALAGVCAQQEGQPTIAECKLLDNIGYGAKWWRLAAGHIVQCTISGSEMAGLYAVGKGTRPKVEGNTFDRNRGIGLYVSGEAGGTYFNNVQQNHAYCGFKVTKSCTAAVVLDNTDRDAIAREQAAAAEAARKAHEAVEAAALKMAAEKLDEERRLRKIYGKDWQKHSKLQPVHLRKRTKNAVDAAELDAAKPTYDLEYKDGDLEYNVPESLIRPLAAQVAQQQKLLASKLKAQEEAADKADADDSAIELVKKKLRAAGNLFDDDWAALFEKCDTRGEGALDLPDFTKALRNVCRLSAKMLPKVQIKKVFEAVDLDHGGDIDVEEFTAFLQEGGEIGVRSDNDSDDETYDTLASSINESKTQARDKKTKRHRKEAENAMQKALSFREGSEVEARFGGKKKWFRATVVKIHAPKQTLKKVKSARSLSAAQKKVLGT